MTPFTIAVSDADIADLKNRLARTRFPYAPADAGWDDGIDDKFLR
ncbi:epoxide hydrolase N-terminal domain-containing protein [Devosia sp. A8/3-2]|nr:epoxide hydrolase N-terminal domain-containing protein [Devosia sp. A8/3-2]